MLAAIFLCSAVAAGAQSAPAVPSVLPAQPLESIPYTPSLDLASMDRTVDPCVDFYAYTCNGWKKANPIPADQAGWSVYGKLGNENQQFLWGILRDDAAADSKTRTPVQQKIGDYFSACMNTEAIDTKGLAPVALPLARIATEPDRKALISALAELDRGQPGSFFFSAGTGQDALDSSTVIVEVGAGGLGLPDRDYYLKTDPRSVKLREQYVAYVTQLMRLAGAKPEAAQADAAAVMKVETALAKASLTRVERRDPHKTYHTMTLSELQGLVPSIDWKRFFAEQGAGSFSTLNVSQPEFMKAVNAELETEPVDTLKSYLQFHLLTAAAPALSAPFRDAQFAFYSTTLRGTPAMPPRWKQCTREVDRNLGEALGQEFVRRTFTPEMKTQTQLMTTQIEAAMGQEIEGLDWMTPATKQEALRKLHAIRNKIGYPDHWRDYSSVKVSPNDYFGDLRQVQAFERTRMWAKLGKPVDRNEWGMTPPTVNAYFNPQMNDINFPAGVLQPPLYDSQMDDAPNYGNTGATIGHELTHAFDDEGRQFDAAGNLKDWWTPADAEGFKQRLACVQTQYAGYTVVDDIHINSKLTSGEDVADLGGTLLAYLAWKKETAGKTLVDRDGFTPDQRFFIGMGQWACENERPANLRLSAATNPHSPGEARINGVVSDLPQFGKAFGCKVGQPMMRQDACKIW